jgi:hypothetical protein
LANEIWSFVSARVPICLLFLALAAADSAAQSRDSSQVVTPGTRYAMSGFGRIFWGDHYRDAWTTPIEVRRLNLRAFAGGLVPIKRGGGRQTKSLRLLGANGRLYSFRSIDKNPAAALPPVLRTSLAAEVLQDQISSQHPAGAIVCDPILQAAGVLHAKPQLVVMSDDTLLGEFREEFAGMLGMIEERPDESDDSLAAFAGAERVVSSEELLDKVLQSAETQVNSRALLNARLLDFFLGDWDRHFDQWRWARFGVDSASGWYPIPRDRDQVFSKLDGVFPHFAQWRMPTIVGFSEEYSSVFSLHWNSRDLDRQFLSALEQPVWDSVAGGITERLTDEVIESAVRLLPTELYEIDGPWLENALKQRRAALPDAAEKFYKLLAHEVEVHGTDLSEDLHITELSDGLVEITLTERSSHSPYFRRRFDPDETEEIRIRLHDSDDAVRITGGQLGLTVRIVGGKGDDTFRFESPATRIRLYDARGSNRIVGSPPPRTRIDERRYRQERHTAPRDWGKAVLPRGRIWYSSDYGFLFGGGIHDIRYGFRRDPYATKWSLLAALSTDGRYDLSIDYDYRAENSDLHFGLRSYATSFDVVNYYGTGNDSPELGSADYYEVKRTLFVIEPLVAVSNGEWFDIGFGPSMRYSQTRDNEGRYIATLPELYGTGGFGEVGLVLAAEIDTRRGMSLETLEHLEDLAGVGLEVDGSVFASAWDVESSYGTARAVARAYVPTGLIPHTVLALRAGGEKVWGDYPWFDAAYIGGLESLRGWRSDRFAGDASLFGSAEIRTLLTSIRVLMPHLFGIFGSVDGGKVWVDGESPGSWHVGYGGGIWLGFLGSRHLFSASYFEGDGSSRFYIDWGFAF